MRADLLLDGVMHVGAVVIEGGQGADGRHHDRHRVRVASEALEETVELIVHHGVVSDREGELLQLVRGRQITVQKQVADLQKTGMLGQLLDRIAAIEQHAFVAIDIGDLALAARRRGEAWIVGENVGFAIQLADVHHFGPNAALQDGKRNLLAVHRDGGGPVGRDLAFHRAPSQ